MRGSINLWLVYIECNAKLIATLLVASLSACFTNTKNLMFCYLRHETSEWNLFRCTTCWWRKLLYWEFFILEIERKRSTTGKKHLLDENYPCAWAGQQRDDGRVFFLLVKMVNILLNGSLHSTRHDEMAPPLSNWTWTPFKPLHRVT